MKLSSNVRKYALNLLQDYRIALNYYHKDDPETLSRIETWKMHYNRGWYYIESTPMRRKEIERRIAYLFKGK